MIGAVNVLDFLLCVMMSNGVVSVAIVYLNVLHNTNGHIMTVHQTKNVKGENMSAIEKKLFDLLDKLAQQDKENVKEYHSKDNVDALKKLAILLNDQMSISDDMTSSAFADCVYELRQIKQTWSRKLGTALIMASENRKNGDLDSAISILENFIKDCPSLFYRDVASIQIDNYKVTES